MPRTRNERIAAWFNSTDWPVEYDSALVDALHRRTLMLLHLSDYDLFERVLRDVREDMVRHLGHNFSLHEVKVRVNVIRRRFYQFMAFTCLPGVQFDRHWNRLQFTPEYNGGPHGETQANREFRRYGFPYYMVCRDVFERKDAASVIFNNPAVNGVNGQNALQREENDARGPGADHGLARALEHEHDWVSDGYSSDSSQNTWSR